MPRLLTRSMQPADPLHPIAYSLSDKLTPLSTAAITLPHDAPDVPLRAFVELFTADGSAGIFRVVKRHKAGSSSIDLVLQHGLCTLSDHMHPGESEATGSCRTLLTKLLSNQSTWVLGTVDVPDDEELTWEINNTNDLQGLTALLKELPGYCLDFDQRALPWVLHVRRKPDEISCEARIDRNLVDVQVEYDTSEMCNVAYADGLAAPITADNVDDWGPIERHVYTTENLGASMVSQIVARHLEQHKNPRVTITLTAVELSRLTGEPFDRFQKGMLCRCILDDMTVVQRIETIDRPDPIGAPEDVVLTLASTQNDLSVTVAGLVVNTQHTLREVVNLKTTKTKVDGFSTRISEVEIQMNNVLGELALKASYADLASEMNEVGILLDSVNSTLEGKASHIDLENGFTEVSLRLDAQANEIYLKANRTYVDNLVAQYVLAQDFDALRADVANLEALLGDFSIIRVGTVSADDVNTTFLSSTTFTHAGALISQRAVTMGAVSSAGRVLSTGEIDLQHSHNVTVGADGTLKLGEVAADGGSFNIADTQFYKNGVSAANSSGYNSGYSQARPASISGESGYSPGRNTYDVAVRVYSNDGTSRVFSLSIDASSAYDAGYAAGSQAAKDAAM